MFLSSLPRGQSLTRCLSGWAQHESENSLVSGNPGIIIFTTCSCNMTPIWVARCDDVYCTTSFNYVHVQVDTLYINELMCNCRLKVYLQQYSQGFFVFLCMFDK